ncbi:MFS transporter [Salinimicrobium xinjiangense]|uniref:MFS transporter n=1 Tax=Salinimicrobium xinjiangense TaxID=438596 RepID=UPI000428EF15|nr:MFS transporter [Salinimicrobium xinjiangense]
MSINRQILPAIVFAQFCCTSLWFAGNGIMQDLLKTFDLAPAALGHLTSAVQFGFITGTLAFAFLTIADRFSPSKVFFYSALFGALFNLGMTWEGNTAGSLLLLRFLTGFSLAGIYPVGMKIASDYYRKGLGTSLGFLVGALVVGTAFPHLLRAFTGNEALPWKLVLFITSALAAFGGIIILLLVPDGPYRRPMLIKNFSAFISVFKIKEFRAAAFGYFGHMWELYAFWAFVPFILAMYKQLHPNLSFDTSLMSFIVIGSGGIACVTGGFISRRLGSKRTAATALFLSGLCCLLSPLSLLQSSVEILLIFLIFWGLVVVADSPLFSTLVAKHAPEEARGTALTIVNSIGFAITIFSIQLLNFLSLQISHYYLFLFLAPGPVLGLYFLYRKRNATKL